MSAIPSTPTSPTVSARARELWPKFLGFALELLKSRRLILELTRREFRGRFLGSAFGLIWAFVHPAALMLIYFVVFKYGLGFPPVNGYPMFVWMLSGLVSWFMAADIIIIGSTAVVDNRFLVKKVVFRVSLLPVVRLLTMLPVHVFFVLALIGVFWGYGYPPRLETLQLFYYLPALFVLGLGWTWLISAMVPFVKDLAQAAQVLVQLLFFTMPLIWPETKVPAAWQWLIYVNPLYYIVGGYRDAMVYHIWFWQHPGATIYFWIFTIALFCTGGIVFMRLRPQFADVL